MRYNWLFFLVIVCFMPWRVGAQSDTEPPVIEVWRLWQPGDLTFRICIKVTDQGSGVNNSTVRLYCNKTPGWLNSWTEDFWEYPNYPDFYETVADGGFLVSINNGDQILWKIEASDNAGNTFHYPEDLPDRVQVCDPWEGPEWCRTSMLDLESLNDLKTFYYNLSYPGGACEAFSFKQDGDDIKVYNNTTIWYTMEVSPSSLNPLQGFSFLTPDLYMPKPKSGLIPLDLSYYMMDNSVKIPNATSVDQITVNIDRKSYDAIIKNVWDMVLVSVKPALGKIAPLDWDLIIKAVEMVINSRIALQNNPAQDVNSLTLKCCEKVFSNETKKVLAKQLANYFVAHHPELSFKTALGGAMKTVSGAWTLITGFYNRFSFLVDVCRFPNDQESFQLVKESPLSLVESTIPGTFDYTGNDSIFVDDTMTFNISISIPPNNQRPYFKLYPEIIIYSPLGETIETTYIPDYNYNPEGGINLSFAGLINENLGVPLNPAALNTGFGITIHNYPWTVSSRGYRYKASLRPYYMEVLLYQNGLPGINVNPFEPDKEIYSGKIPFYLYDTVSPVKPQFAQISRFVSSFNYGFVVNDTVIPDIRYYNVYRQLPGEPEYSLLIDTIPSLGKQLCFFTEQFDTPYGYISYKIQAVDMTGKVSPMSDPLLINPPEVSQITLSATPMSTHLFDTITVTAAIRDVSGNIIAGELIEFSSDNSGYFIGDVDNKVYSDTLGSATIAYFPTSAGQHYLSAHSYNGISAQLTNPVNVNGNVPPGFVVITQFEYWFDDNVTDTHSSYLLPGVNVEFDEIITATELVPGQHTFNYRFKDSNGRWSSPVSQPFFKNGDYGGSSCQVTQWQYWFDGDISAKVTLSVPENPGITLSDEIALSNLPPGLHVFHIRFKDNSDTWSSPLSQYFFKGSQQSVNTNVITAYRYFFDTDFSGENRMQFQTPAATENLITTIAPSGLPPGSYTLYFQFQDTLGLWSSLINAPVTLAGIPLNRTVADNVTVDGQSQCFDATHTLTAGGVGSSFLVQNGGSATLIAGQNIILLPGVKVETGGYLSAYITSTGNYCSSLSPAMAPKELDASDNILLPEYPSSIFKVYPNPTTGNFILELTGDNVMEKVKVELYGTLGEKLLSEELTGERKHEFSLDGKPTGIYYIRVISGTWAESAKIIKQ